MNEEKEMKGHTPKKSVRVRLAKIRKKLRNQLKELTYALEFYLNTQKEYLVTEIERVRKAILNVKLNLLYPSLY